MRYVVEHTPFFHCNNCDISNIELYNGPILFLFCYRSSSVTRLPMHSRRVWRWLLVLVRPSRNVSRDQPWMLWLRKPRPSRVKSLLLAHIIYWCKFLKHRSLFPCAGCVFCKALFGVFIFIIILLSYCSLGLLYFLYVWFVILFISFG